MDCKNCVNCTCDKTLFSDPPAAARQETGYEVLYIDPPWSYNNKATRAAATDHYPVMSLQEIKDLVIPAAENSILFLWSTATLLQEALEVMEHWNFKYKTSAVWDKELIGLGNYFRIQHELLLIGIKGKFQTPAPADRFSSVIREKRTKHSKKPVRAYELIERMYPDKSKIELFARNLRPGWISWGNEIINNGGIEDEIIRAV